MRKRRVPKYPSKPHKTGQARVRIDGHDYYLGVFNSSESHERYRQLIATWLSTGAVPVEQQNTSGLTVADVVARWWVYAKEHYTTRGRELEAAKLTFAPLLALYGPTLASAFDSDALEALQRAMASGSWMDEEERANPKRRVIGLCRNVVNRRITRIKTLWRWAERKKLVPPGAWDHLRTVPGLRKNTPGVRNTPKRQGVSEEIVQAVLRYASRRIRAMLEVQWLTGMRSCEVRIMRTCDIDRSGDVWLYRPESDKNDWREQHGEKVVAIGPKAQKILLSWLNDEKPGQYLFRGTRGLVKPNVPISSGGYTDGVQRAAAKAGVDFNPYLCRHSAKVRISRAISDEASRAVLGQTSIDTTALYGGIDLEMAKDAMRKLG